MFRAANLTGKPAVQTEFQATKLAVTITSDLATSVPKSPRIDNLRRQPNQSQPVDASLRRLRLLQSSSCLKSDSQDSLSSQNSHSARPRCLQLPHIATLLVLSVQVKLACGLLTRTVFRSFDITRLSLSNKI